MGCCKSKQDTDADGKSDVGGKVRNVGGRLVHGAAGAGRGLVRDVGALLGHDTAPALFAASAAAAVVAVVPTVERGLLIALDALAEALTAMPSRPAPAAKSHPGVKLSAALDPPGSAAAEAAGAGSGFAKRMRGPRGHGGAAHQWELRRTLCDFRHFAAVSAAEGQALWGDDVAAPGLQIVQWLWTLPVNWLVAFPGASEAARFHRSGVCRLGRDLSRMISERLRPHVSVRSSSNWVQRLRRMPPSAASDGITSCYAYTFSFPPVEGQSFALQLHEVLESSMRAVGVAAVWRRLSDDERDAHRLCLSVLQPFLRALDVFLQWAPVREEPRPAFRVAVGDAEECPLGHWTVWAPFTSVTADATTAREHLLRDSSASAGTLVCVMQRSAADVSFASADAGNAEEILRPNTVQRVVGRLPVALLSLLGTDLRVVVFAEEREDDPPRSSVAAVDLALAALTHANIVFRDYQEHYVEPRLVTVGTGAAAEPLYARFRRFLRSQSEEAMVICGVPGSGKTSAALALAALLSQRGSDDEDMLPIFVWAPEVQGLLSNEPAASGCIAEVIRTQLGLSEQEMWELRVRPLVIIIDAVDEAGGDPAVLRGGGASALLPRCGLASGDWPASKFVITCGHNWAQEHGLSPGCWSADGERCVVTALQRFDDDMEATYLRRLAAQETKYLSQRLVASPSTGSAVEAAVAAMRCHPVPYALARRLQRAGLVETALDEEGEAAAEAAADGAEGSACITHIVQETEGVLHALRSAHDADILHHPFVLHCAVTVAATLARRPRGCLAAAPLKEVYEAWLVHDVQRRLRRLRGAADPLGDGFAQLRAVISAAQHLAAAMFADGKWRSTVGAYRHRIDLHPGAGDDLRHAVLACMPLRCASLERDSDVFMFRHRSVHEFLLARLIETSPSGVAAVGGRSLGQQPLACRFFAESVRSLRLSAPQQAAELAAALTAAARRGDAHTPNARLLLEGGAALTQSVAPGEPGGAVPLSADAAAILSDVLIATHPGAEGGVEQQTADELDALIDGYPPAAASAMRRLPVEGSPSDPLLAPSPRRTHGAVQPPPPPLRDGDGDAQLFLPLAPAAPPVAPYPQSASPPRSQPRPPPHPPIRVSRGYPPLPPRFAPEAPPPGCRRSPHSPPRWTALI